MRHRSRWVAALAAAAAAALALTLVPGAQATKKAPAPAAVKAKTAILYGGATTVALDTGAAGALESLGISVAPAKPAFAGKEGVSFPITVGRLNAETLAGKIRHSGGLVFTKGDTSVYLTRFVINIDEDPDLTGKVGVGQRGGDRASLFTLDLSDLKVSAAKGRGELSGVTLKLTQGAADALNAVFGEGQEPFSEGLVIGTATVRAHHVLVPARVWH
ncbi:MAG: hypothetical protein K2X91_12855 [Thermoleophilia bacterium]|nr:hypothetical protein [Thermoleophilia bacterium]